MEEAITAREESLGLCQSTGNRIKEGDALRWLSRLLWFGGNKYAADKYAAEAIAVLEASGASRELANADRYINEGIVYCEERDLGSWATYMSALRAENLLLQGDWQQATNVAEAILRHPRIAPVTRIPALIVLARARSWRGDPRVESTLNEAYALAKMTGELQRLGPIALARAEFAWLNGNPAGLAADELERCYAQAEKHADQWMRGELAFWLSRLDRLKSVPDRIAAPFALQISGDWRGAATAWKALGCPYEEAIALAETREEGDVRTALAIFERLGTGPMSNRARRSIRATGIRKIPLGAQARTRNNPHGLTNRELHVLSLLAEGRRNAEIARRLFVADKTVDHHVSAILAKLNVCSRGEAAAIANQLGLRPAASQSAPAKRQQ